MGVEPRNLHGIENPPDSVLRGDPVQSGAMERFAELVLGQDASSQPPAEPEEDDGGAGEYEEGEDRGSQAGEEEEVGEEQEGEEGEPDESKVKDLPDEYRQAQVTLKDGSRISVEEAIAGYMKDGYFRQRTTQVNETMRELEAMRQHIEGRGRELDARDQKSQHYAWLGATIEANPWMNELMTAVMQGDMETASQIGDQYRATFRPVAPPQDQMRDPRVDQMLLQQEVQRLNAEWSEITASDPEADFPLVAAIAQQNGLRNLKDAYRIAYEEKIREQAKKEGYEDAIREIKKGAQAPTSMKGGRPGAAPKAKKPKSTDPVQAAADAYRS